ncbi:helix-turn-helix transcriptional regulator [Nonomuraea sp. NPDC049725]|uniref:PadR family transcriptional regulator n=1 Tax=Nonomuraea sp. NPDC049725 TaxID=3154508 RepID=UPI00344071B8
MTRSTRAVLAIFLTDPAREFYGLELRAATGLSNGTLYPRLATLEAYGWLESRWEDPEPGRPPRRYYRITREGTERAREARPVRPALRLRPRAQGA